MKKNYILRSALVFLILSSFIGISAISCLMIYGGKGFMSGLECVPLGVIDTVILFPFRTLVDKILNNVYGLTYSIVTIAISIILWTIVGIILGWIYGKIKNRQPSTTTN